MLQYLKQDSAKSRQIWRDQILGAGPDNFMKMVDRLGAWGSPKIVVVTNKKQTAIAAGKGLNITTCDYDGYTCDEE